MKPIFKVLMARLALGIVLLTPMAAKAGPKDLVHLRFPGSNEACKTFMVVSNADRPMTVNIEVCDQRQNAPNWFVKVRVDPGEEVCVNDRRYLSASDYCLVYIVGAWYTQ
jgi:hypothetical protein